ncbi:MAG: PhzF family phenazine biosynthesis protein [Desulfarculaceae bacterium]|jgi:PhzF family phenazine biosynthesis protein
MSQIKVRPFKQVDVFTDRPGFGNPVAVIMEAEGLSTEQMQRVARWTNLSETTFLLNTDKAGYQLRIFTPAQEIPFAGHPTIGSAHAALEQGLVKDPTGFEQRCGIGDLPLWWRDGVIWVRVPTPKQVEAELKPERLSQALGGAQVHDPLLFDTGPIWIVSRLDSLDALRGLQVDRDLLTRLSLQTGQAVGATLYAFNQEGGIEVRSLAPAHGIDEDPVCGSGNLCAAAHLKATGEINRIGNQYQARQGMNLGREGCLHLNVLDDAMELGGRAVTVFEGQARV